MTKKIKQTQKNKRRAAKANLFYVESYDKGYSRTRRGKGFVFRNPRNNLIQTESTKKRLKSLAIPPAWSEVWICPKSNGHIQATGYDENGRKQYIYHPVWRSVSENIKFDRLFFNFKTSS